MEGHERSTDGRARVRLTILGEDREVAVPEPPGKARLADLLPVSRAISDEATSMAVERERAEGRTPSCREGCAACCRQLVPISVVEARAIAETVEALPDARRKATRERFAEAVAKLEALGLLDAREGPGRATLRAAGTTSDRKAAWAEVVARYFSAKIPCPLLEDERCSLYEQRPLVCREYLVTSAPELCAKLGAARVVPRPLPGSEALATAARELLDEGWPLLPLPLALEWSGAEGAKLDLETEGENLLNHLLAAAEELGG